jgi:hypothetical protein
MPAISDRKKPMTDKRFQPVPEGTVHSVIKPGIFES